MRKGLRFHPPAVHVSPELHWILWRAFGPANAPLPPAEAPRPEAVLALAARLDQATRTAGRTRQDLLEAELGPEAALRLRRSSLLAVAATIRLELLCTRIAVAGVRVGAPLVFLKGAALHLGGVVPPGLRPFADVDVLTPPRAAEALHRALAADGFQVVELPSAQQHLPILTDPAAGQVEVHHMVLGVRLPARTRPATADDLLEVGLCSRVESLPGACYLPCRDVLVAHLLAHGLAQHGWRPQEYPALRLLADLQDLRMDHAAWQGFLHGPVAWVTRDVGRDEVEATADLVLALTRGEDPSSLAAGEGGAATLLRHMLAGSLDEPYRRSLALRAMADPLPARSRLLTILRLLWHDLWLTREQVDLIYGPPASALGYLGRRLGRPFQMTWRAVGSAAAWAKVRGRNPENPHGRGS